MTDHVVSGLIAKRAELAGIIDQLQRQLDQYRADLTHIDGVLRVLAVDLDLGDSPEAVYRRNRYFARNELSRPLSQCVPGQARRAVGIDEIAGQVFAVKGSTRGRHLAGRDPRSDRDIVKRLHGRGEVEKIGQRRDARWRLVI